MPTDQDVAKLTEALRKEREAHAATKAATKTTHDSLQAEITAANERTTTLQATLKTAESQSAADVARHISDSVAAGIAAKTASLQSKLSKAESALAESATTIGTLQGTLTSRTISENVREIARAQHVRPDALADIVAFGQSDLVLNDAGEVVTKDGGTIDEWIDARKATSPYLWPVSRGAGARGSNNEPAFVGLNPFAAKGQPGHNLTEQGRIARDNPAMAEMLMNSAKLAG